jgi:serine-type D-Ala-D-Ala carboxypeptidase/endopeptidase
VADTWITWFLFFMGVIILFVFLIRITRPWEPSKVLFGGAGKESVRWMNWAYMLFDEGFLPWIAINWCTQPFLPKPLSNGLSVVTTVYICAWSAAKLKRQWMHRKNFMTDSADWKAALQQAGSRYVRRKPGAILVVGVLNGPSREIHVFQREGLIDTETAKKLLFEIGSITKVFTSALLADMVLHQEVHLEDEISKFLGDKLPANSSAAKITLLQLATHTSGLPRLAPQTYRTVFLQGVSNPYRDFSEQDLLQYLSKCKNLQPTKTAKYSNLGMDLLSYVLSLRCGESFEHALRRRICLPLGLYDTVMTLGDGQARRLVPGHSANGRTVPNWDFQFGGAGGLYSTVDDLLTFLEANLGHIDADIAESLGLCHVPRDKKLSGTENVIGLNWLIHPSGITWHNGGTGGYRSFIGFSKQKGVGVVVLSNYAVSVDDIGFTVLNIHPGRE